MTEIDVTDKIKIDAMDRFAFVIICVCGQSFEPGWANFVLCSYEASEPCPNCGRCFRFEWIPKVYEVKP